jgi:hypothetical protein
MAKLGGTKVQLTDIRKKFALKPGGKVYDLSEKLDFCILGIDDGAGGVIPKEVVTDTNLSLSGFSQPVESSSYRPLGFSMYGTGSVTLSDANSYPSYLKDEQTVLIFMRNNPSGSSDKLGGSIFSPHPNFTLGGGSATTPDLNPLAKYRITDRMYFYANSQQAQTGTDTRDNRFYDRALRHQFLLTMSRITTGSQEVPIIPFFVGGYYQSDAAAQRKIVVPSFSYKDVIYETNSTVQADARYVSRVTGSIIVPAAESVILGYDRKSNDSNEFYRTGTTNRNIGFFPAMNGLEEYTLPLPANPGGSGLVSRDDHAAGRSPMRQPPTLFTNDYPSNAQGNDVRPYGNIMRLSQEGNLGFDPSMPKSDNDFHLLAFRQRLASENDYGYMSITVDEQNVLNQGVSFLPEGSSRFTKLDRSKYHEMIGSTEMPSILRSIGANPDRMSLGEGHDYVLVAGWSRCLSDDEIQAINSAMKDGVYESSVTSYSAAPLSSNSSKELTNHVREFSGSGITESLIQFKTDDPIVSGFTDSENYGTLSNTSISIPVITNVNPYSKGFCYRAHGATGVGEPRVISFNDVSANSRVSQMMYSTLTVTGTYPTPLVRNLYSKNSEDFPPQADGNIGTGFLYYSPSKCLWVEKRIDQSTSNRDFTPNDLYLTDTSTVAKQSKDWIDSSFTGTHNVLEYRNNSTPGSTDQTNCSFDISGSSRIFGQFSGSPNIGYLHPWKESQEIHGYGRIGYPTAIWGAPTDKKYHAHDSETFKMSDFIDRPFLVSEIRLKLNIEASRSFMRMTGSITGSTSTSANIANFAHNDHGQWVKYIMNRRDIENYSFFIYRQRRRGGVLKDSQQDISSSERFLVASASVTFYNSASFGGSYKDGFWVTASNHYDSTKTTNPLYTLLHGDSFNQEIFRTIFTSASFDQNSSFNIAPGITSSLTKNSEPLHGPAYSHNWGVDFTHRGSLIHNKDLSLKLKPSVAPQGFTCPTLMTFVSGVGNHTGKKWNVPVTGVFDGSGNLLFHRPIWNHTGHYAYATSSYIPGPSTVYNSDGPGTYAYQVVNYWHGGTRIPKVFSNSSFDTESKTPTLARNFVRYIGTNFNTIDSRDSSYNAVRQSPSSNFGKSIFDIVPSFSQFTSFDPTPENIVTPRYELSNIIVDGRAINCPTINASRIQTNNFPLSTSSINFHSIIQPGWWQGIAPVSPKIGPEILETDYLLLPGDELVLGLESSNFATPDFGPTFMTGAYKDLVGTYLPTSYMRVMPGIGEIQLIGRYLRNGEASVRQRNLFGDITTVIGDEASDEFIVTETDGYYGGIFDEIITGSIFSETNPRGVAGHATAGDIKGNFSVNRFFTVYTDRYVRDYYDDQIKNTLRVTGSIPGDLTSKFKIPQKVVLTSHHYGHLRDFLETPPYQVLAPVTRGSSFNSPPVTVRFVEKGSTQFENVDEFQKSQTSPLSVQGSSTTSQNVNKFSRLDGPFKDGEFTDRDELEYTVTV